MDQTRTLIIDFSNNLRFTLQKNAWNLIGISRQLSKSYKASDLVALGCSKVIYRDTNGVYKSYIYQNGTYYGSDFSINSYSAYFVYYTKSTQLVLKATEPTGPVTLSLTEGYNLIAVPHSGITSLDVTQDVDGAKNVLVRRSGTYKSFTVASSPSSSFSLREKEGIYIFVDRQTSWVIK
jgi:hypothetical protein